MTEHERVVAEVVNEARRRWPAVRPDAAAFAAYLGERTADGVPPGELQLVDLFLAFACAAGDEAAIAAFRTAHLPGITATLRALRADGTVTDEVISRLHEELFTRRPDAPPKIAQYAGRSSLHAWLQVATTRMALRLTHRERRIDATEASAEDPLARDIADPELSYLKAIYRDAFQSAFADAAGALSSRDRNLLRYQFVDRLTGDEIARLHGVHRATAVRWLGQACDALLDGTRQRLMARTAVDGGEFDSITRLVRSQLDFSIRALFAQVDR